MLSLQPVARSVLGVEADPDYVAFSRILAAKEGLPEPDIRIGTGEELPIDSGSADRVVLFTALQYMDLRRVAAEAAG